LDINLKFPSYMPLKKISLKNKKRILLTLTIFISFFFFLSGFLEITKHDSTYPKTLGMGYPPYFITTLGIAKLIGALAFLIPSSPRLKEWVFAAFTIDVIFAFISGYHIQSYSDCLKAGISFAVLMITYRLHINIQEKEGKS